VSVPVRLDAEWVDQVIQSEDLDLRLVPVEGDRATTLVCHKEPPRQSDAETVYVTQTIVTRAIFRNGELYTVILGETTRQLEKTIRLSQKNMLDPDATSVQPDAQADLVRRLLVSHLNKKGKPIPGVAAKEAIVDLYNGFVVVYPTPLPEPDRDGNVLLNVMLLVPQSESIADRRRATRLAAEREIASDVKWNYEVHRELVG
jgi:hypothetical protein